MPPSVRREIGLRVSPLMRQWHCAHILSHRAAHAKLPWVETYRIRQPLQQKRGYLASVLGSLMTGHIGGRSSVRISDVSLLRRLLLGL